MTTIRHSILALIAGALLAVTGNQAWAQDSTIPFGAFGPNSAAALTADSGDEDKSEHTHFEGMPEDFITGLQDGFEKFPRPIGSPLYFTDPFINTDIRPFVLHHEFPKDSLLGGGDLTVFGLQAHIAVTDRLQIIATQDGYSDLEADALPAGEGWNDLAAGLKYAFYVDAEKQAIASIGARWTLSNGSREIFKGIEDEISVFVSGAKKYGKCYITVNAVGRVTTHHGHGNDSLSWDIAWAYELCPGFFPLLEYHGFYYLSNGDRIAVRDGLLDYGNLGAGDVAGSSAHWGTAGFRVNLKEDVSWGAGYGFALNRESNNDIFADRFTTNLIIQF